MKKNQLEEICKRQRAQIRELKAEMQRRDALHNIKLFTATEQAEIEADALRAEIHRLERLLRVKSNVIDGLVRTSGMKGCVKEG
jgi:hypothetical protein